MAKKYMIVLVGWSGAGKSTLSHEFAKKHDFAKISEDDFVFHMNPRSFIKRTARSADRNIGMENMLLVLDNYIKNRKSIVIEGALVDGPTYLKDFENIAKENNYNFVPIMIIADRKNRRSRKKKKGYVVPMKVDKKLIETAISLGYHEVDNIIDTTKLSVRKSLLTIEKIALD
jgi:adenylate kinase family enzyme